MAEWYTHYLIAKKLAHKYPFLDEGAFILGNLAPDFGQETGIGNYQPSGKITHFSKDGHKANIRVYDVLNNYLLKTEDLKEISFIYGYFTHLVSDHLYAVNYFYPLLRRLGIAFEDKEEIDKIRKDRLFLIKDQIDEKVLKEIASLDTKIAAIDFISSDLLAKMIKRILNIEYPKNTSLITKDTFLDDNFSKIESILKAWLEERKDYQVLLFDLDETILDFKKAEMEALDEVFTDNGIPVSDDLIAAYEEVNAALWKMIEKGEFKKKDLEKTRFKETFKKLQMDDSLGVKCGQDYTLALSKRGYFLPHAKEVLNKLKDEYQIAIVTNGFKYIQKRRIQNCGLNKLIDAVFISEDIGFEKPDVRYFKEVFKKFDINKDNYLMIGDSLSSDIKGAKNAKIDAFWIHQNINDDKGLPMGDDLLTFYTWLKRPKLF